MDKDLLSFQVAHVYQLDEALKENNCVLDASDTGTGKTYCAISVCKLNNYEPLIICPKSVIHNWNDVAKKLGVKIFGIANYEMMKGCKYYTSDLELVDCPFIDKYTLPEEKAERKKIISKRANKEDDKKITNNKIESKNVNKKTSSNKSKKEKESFIYQFPNNVILIFDEAHRGKNHKTITSRLLVSAIESGNKIMLLSATITDKIDCFRPFGVLFGFYHDVKQYKTWIRRKVKLYQLKNKDSTYNPDEMALSIIHSELFPKFGSRMKIKELGNLFPSNQIIAKCYFSESHNEINKLYDEINLALEDLKNKEMRSDGLGKIVRARQKIEMYKIPIILDLAEEAIDSGYSVAIFVNFKDTMNTLCKHLNCVNTISGDQSMDERQLSINEFQSNKSKIIIAIIQAGGVGISLHDIHGGHPRMSIISPSWTGQDIVQVLGRIHRAGSKTPALQRIVYIAETVEEKIAKTIEEKITTIHAINDGDLVHKKFDKEELELIEEKINNINNKKKDKLVEKESDMVDDKIMDRPKTKHIIKTKKSNK